METPISKLTIGITVLVMYVMTEPEAPIATVLSNIILLIGQSLHTFKNKFNKPHTEPKSPKPLRSNIRQGWSGIQWSCIYQKAMFRVHTASMKLHKSVKLIIL